VLSKDQAIESTRELLAMRETEKTRLAKINDYLRDDPQSRRLPGLPEGAPNDVVRLAKLSRVNLMKYIVNARVQAMYVDGFRTPDKPEDVAAWRIWQANRMDARQIGVHRASLAFGASYVTVLPGRPVPVMRGSSPTAMTVAYGDDDEWPRFALEKRTDGTYRLLDETHAYRLTVSDNDVQFVSEAEHGATYAGEPVCPVVRFRDTDDLDDPVRGIVEPQMTLQDQINVTTFGLMVAQHYGAFRQRYVIGWLAENETEALKASASRLMQFEDAPGDVQVGEFAQTDLRGYIESREATIRHLATVSQTPVHELMGQFINLSAEALEAARASHQAAIDENRIMAGESWEQSLNLGAEMMGVEPDPTADVIWRDTRVRGLADAANALGTLVDKLGVPKRELWSRVPGVPQHEVERWRQAADEENALDGFGSMLGDGGTGGGPAGDPTNA
jgi:hypothetical protein